MGNSSADLGHGSVVRKNIQLKYLTEYRTEYTDRIGGPTDTYPIFGIYVEEPVAAVEGEEPQPPRGFVITNIPEFKNPTRVRLLREPWQQGPRWQNEDITVLTEASEMTATAAHRILEDLKNTPETNQTSLFYRWSWSKNSSKFFMNEARRRAGELGFP